MLMQGFIMAVMTLTAYVEQNYFMMCLIALYHGVGLINGVKIVMECIEEEEDE